MTTAFVLSGGASLGAIQAGMLGALYEREIEPDLIVGTSVGAINGSFIASRPRTPETAAELADVWRGVRRSDVFPLNPLSGLAGFLGRRANLIGDGGLRRLLDAHLQVDRLEDAAVPLHVIATDLFTGLERRLSRGDATAAVLASAAIPGVFAPVEWEQTQLIDGGVSNNAPISHALELGAERVYVLPTGTTCALPEPPRGALAVTLHAMSLLIMRRLIVEIELLAERAELIVLPPPCPLEVQPIDFSRADELIHRGFRDARAHLERCEEEGTTSVPFSMRPHSHRPDADHLPAPSASPRDPARPRPRRLPRRRAPQRPPHPQSGGGEQRQAGPLGDLEPESQIRRVGASEELRKAPGRKQGDDRPHHRQWPQQPSA